MNIEFYKSLYEEEWARKDELQSSASIALGILTLVGGALVFLIQQLESLVYPWRLAFLIAAASAGVAMLGAIYQLVRTHVGYVYRRLAFPTELLSFQNDLIAWYRSYAPAMPQPERERQAEAEFNHGIVERLVEATDRNTRNNVKRGEHLHRANLLLVITLIFVLTAAIPVGVCMLARNPMTPT